MIEIFVFGSNLAGRHGKGAALAAMRDHGAQYGQGWGLQGRSYAIPTKGKTLGVMSLENINHWVEVFLGFARSHPEMTFNVTAIGTGLAGYRHQDIAPMFMDAPANCRLPETWRQLLAALR